MKTAAIILGHGQQARIYPPEVRTALGELVNVVLENCTPEEMGAHTGTLAGVEVLFSGWGAPQLDAANLARMPHLEVVFYGAGTLKNTVTEAFWQTGLPICSAWAANAVPVAEFTFAQIILALKQVHRCPGLLREVRRNARPPHFDSGGAFGTTVGLVSLGQIGRRVAEWLKGLAVKVVAYDPFCPPEVAAKLGVELVSLEAVFERSRVVSLHAPWLPETVGMITGDLLRRLPPGGAFINTARGAIVREDELIAVMQERPDLMAVLDVTYPEPPVPESPLYDLPNVFLTPHLAGSEGRECGRMGLTMVEECRRWLNGEPLHYAVSREAFAKMA